ncbi:MAG: hypothetical protein ACRDL5_13350, partial [Solirubrobacteraceae bacterium]
MSTRRRTAWSRAAVAIAAAGMLAAGGLISANASSAAPSLGALRSALGDQQARQRSLSTSIDRLDGLISTLDSQIALVQQRAAAVAGQLARDRVQLARVGASLARERALLARLRRRLAVARRILARQLVSGYESNRPDLVSVVLNADGFNQLLDELSYLGQAEHQQQSIIAIVRAARAQADAAALRLTALQSSDRRLTADTE